MITQRFSSSCRPATKVLTLGSSLVALGMVLAGSAIAQEAASSDPSEQQMDAIVVTGIRGSLLQAINIKRESNSIVDAVSSEALGKFPDSNVAESLQRIPGVSIDRQGGEGRFVTVRGFGPEFNTVLVNGRTFASDNEGRSFSFDLLAAELITGAQVYKSSQARLQDGGVGATLNVNTARPFDLNGFKLIASAKGLYETNNDDVSPQLFGLVSNTFADDKVGVTLSLSYQKRQTRRPFIEDRGYLPGSTAGNPAAPLFTNVFAPRNQDNGVETQDRSRFGAYLALQFRPVESLTLTFDGLYNRFDVDSDVRSLGSWFEPSEYSAATIDDNRTVTSLTTNGNGDLIVTSANRDTRTYAGGFNAEWKANDNVTLSYDTSWSRARDLSGGADVFTVIGIPATYDFVQASGDGFPSVLNYRGRGVTAGIPDILTNPNIGRAHYVQRQGNNTSERVLEHKFDTEFKSDGGMLDAFRIGVIYTNRRKSLEAVESDPRINCLYCGYASLVPASLLQPFNLGSFLSGGGSVPTQFQTYDPEAYLAYLASPAGTTAQDLAAGNPVGTSAAVVAATNGYTPIVLPRSYNVTERTYAGYLEADFKGTLGSVPVFANIGARYIFTELFSAGRSQILTDLLPVAGDPTIFNAVFAPGGALDVRDTNSYAYFLPNINIKVDPIENFSIRFGASRTLTRPQVSLLAPSTTFTTFRPASLDGVGGNPDLKPYLSDNFDLSFEWYPTRSISFAIAPYFKRISNFIQQTREAEEFTIANAGNLAINGVTITGANEASFLIRRPRNTEDANVRGIEISGNIGFDGFFDGWLGGFGVNGNATFVNTNATYDPNSTTNIFALEGLGDTWNITGYYEYDKISMRVAFNQRGRFLENLVTPGQGGDPVFRRKFGQLDIRGSYQVLEYLQVFFEGTNVTNAQNVQTGRFDNQVLRISKTGSRYALGLRADF